MIQFEGTPSTNNHGNKLIKNEKLPKHTKLFFCGFHPVTSEVVVEPHWLNHIENPTSLHAASSDLLIGWSNSAFLNRTTGDVKTLFSNSPEINTWKTATSCFGYDRFYAIDDDNTLHVMAPDESLTSFVEIRAFKLPSSLKNVVDVSIMDEGRLFILWNKKENVPSDVKSKWDGGDLRGCVGSVDVRYQAKNHSATPTAPTTPTIPTDSTTPTTPTTPVLHPVDVQVSVAEVACGKSHALFRSNEGEVFSQGSNSRGQLGIEGVFELNFSSSPERLEALEGVRVTTVAAGGWHSLALSDAHDVYLWGWNEAGQCARPFEKEGHCDHSERRRSPNEVNDVASESNDVNPDVNYVSDIESGTEGSDACTQTLPYPHPFEDDVAGVAAGSRHSLFRMQDGRVLSCGNNKWGQLGRDSGLCSRCSDGKESDWRPKQVMVTGEVDRIWAGWWNSFFLT